MAKIQSLSTIEVQSKVKGLEDVSYEIRLSSVREKLDIGRRINSAKNEDSAELDKIMTDGIRESVVSIRNLESDHGMISNGNDLIDAWEKTPSFEVFHLAVEMSTYKYGNHTGLKKLEKK